MDPFAEDRRRFLIEGVAVAATSALATTLLTDARASQSTPSAKMVFVLFKRDDFTHEESVAEWMGARHTGIVGKVPGLRRWVQNHPTPLPGGKPDGIGELWFDNAEAMERAMKSPEMGAAVEDAKAGHFLDYLGGGALNVASARDIRRSDL